MSNGVSGTKEWSVASVNVAHGCLHNCYYCYAREMALRFKRIEHPMEWINSKIKRKEAKEKKKYDGVVMYPTTHDITPGLLNVSLEVLKNLLSAGNEVLIVSKPHIYCIHTICDFLEEKGWKDRVQFRFSIGTLTQWITSEWEPGAPTPAERMAALGLATVRGFRTSVSMEPMLNTNNIIDDFHIIQHLVTDSVWLGKMNNVRKRVVIRPDESGSSSMYGMTLVEVELLERGQSDERIKYIYNQLKGHPKVRWKESIKKVVGIPLETEAGTDR